ncbi:hypothetical protein BD311DRAFT_768889 [Dichomitus squalens]|uniref:Uncharacterized protein n=1 Tax=Dichomitus squalens TaxID=114155 RepID=A0A4Q9M828_9APHY|nr:hypothetical protein BD311DRAFT_768889 [Dichomitus squalens]
MRANNTDAIEVAEAPSVRHSTFKWSGFVLGPHEGLATESLARSSRQPSLCCTRRAALLLPCSPPKLA